VDRVHGLWIAQEWLVHGSTVDLTMADVWSSPELSLVATLGHDEAKGRCGDSSGGLTLVGEAVRWASGGGE
jgi:hypothetical protein